MASCLAERFGAVIELSRSERDALDILESRERSLPKGAALVRERDRHGDIYVLRQGRMMSYVLLPDGSRQILRLHFPGDMLAMTALAYRQSPETVAALAESVVAPIDRVEFGAFMVRHPRLSGVMAALTLIERVAMTDRLAALGRTSARARVAALLLEVRNRLRVIDRSVGCTFQPGLTQEEIGDATGLTAVHVNRMLRQLDDDGLIERAGTRVTILNEAAMARAANYVDRFEGLDLGWLPPAG